MSQKLIYIIIFTLLIFLYDSPIIAQEPALPEGLSDQEEEPSLPQGLIDNSEKPEQEEKSQTPFDFSFFLDTRTGIRTQDDPYEKDVSLGESRIQLKLSKEWTAFGVNVTSDFLYDPVINDYDIDLEKGKGFIDLREANLFVTPFEVIDIKIGRQILTWGTGDMLFINDLFPKDWNSFFIGRDDEYLKAPSDAINLSIYTDIIKLDFVYSPRFDADRFIDGGRISYWNGILGRTAGRDAVIEVDKPNNWFDEDEFALRLFNNISDYEFALYGYIGYWKSPGGMNQSLTKAIFPHLNVYGGSIRTSIGKAITNLEVGYYDSTDDRNGDNSLIRNSELRFLVGYEQEIIKELVFAVQYYLELMMNYDNYIQSTNAPFSDEDHHVITLRITNLLLNQNLTLSLFTYFSPSDLDAYFRPNIHYKITDEWSFELGGNLFIGNNQHTFFGQFEKNSNLFIGLRYNDVIL